MKTILKVVLLCLIILFSGKTAYALPAAPSNLAVADVAGGLQLTWKDNSSDELGFYVYRDGALRTDTAQPGLLDTDLTKNVNYCYQVSAFASYYESSKTAIVCAVYTGTIGAGGGTSDPGATLAAFDYPVKSEKVYRSENDIPIDAWYDYQPFAAIFNYSAKIHLGSDVNKGGGDAFQPLYAVADCLVHDYDDTALSTAWGKWLMLKCSAAGGKSFRLSNGGTAAAVFVLYAHIAEIKIVDNSGVITRAAQIVKDSTAVKRGWQVATLGNANGYYGTAYHLHFEVRANGNDLLGPGYTSPDNFAIFESYQDPLEFIANNRYYDQKELRVVIHSQDIDRSKPNHVEIDASVWRRTGRLELSEKRSLGYNDYFWLADSKAGSQASWNFFVPVSGDWELYLSIPHSSATASQVRYTVWHDDGRFPNPFIFDFNQSRNNAQNQRIYVGTFHFYTGKEYALAVAGLTDEVNAKQIALDALELVHYNNEGVGGSITLTDSDQDGMDDSWEAVHGLDTAVNDSQGDPDDDGLVNLAEYYLNTDPKLVDTDGDGEGDYQEFINHYDPTDSNECSFCQSAQAVTDTTVIIPYPVPVTSAGNDPVTGTTTEITVPPIETVRNDQALQPVTDQVGRIYNVSFNNQGGGLSCRISPFESDDLSALIEWLMIVYLLCGLSLYLKVRPHFIRTVRAIRVRNKPPES